MYHTVYGFKSTGISNFFKPVIGEPKIFDKDLFVKYWQDAESDKLPSERSELTMKKLVDYVVIAPHGEEDLGYPVRGAFSSARNGDKETISALKKYLKTGTYVIRTFEYDYTMATFLGAYMRYVAEPLAYALVYPDKPISKEILAALDAVRVLSAKDLAPIYKRATERVEQEMEKAKQKRERKKAEEREKALNVFYKNQNQK